MRTIKIKRGVTEPEKLLDGELGYDISNKTLYIGNDGGKDRLFVGDSVYPKINADYNYYKKADRNTTEGYLGVVNGKIPSNLLPNTSWPDDTDDEIFEVDYVYVPGSNPKKLFYAKDPYDFPTIAPGVELGIDINGNEFETPYADGVTYISGGSWGEYQLMRKAGASGGTTVLQKFNDDSGAALDRGLFICRYDGHIYRIDVNEENEYDVVGLSTPPDVIDGGSW